jgi:hypothetical protein
MAEPAAPKKAPPPPPSRTERSTLSRVEEPQEEDVQIIPTPLENGVPLEGSEVAPGKYLYFSALVEGKEDDLVEFTVSRILHSGATNLYVNFPTSSDYPTSMSHDWTPYDGILMGPPGKHFLSFFFFFQSCCL